MTTGSSRLFAPVAAPPPPKPPQLNLVASALMPDVSTDTFGPGAGPMLASAGWINYYDEDLKRRAWARPPGDTTLYEHQVRRNALIAAVSSMGDMEMQQMEQAAGVTVDSLPESIYGATADSRWTGGFQYAPENQYEAVIADPCGQPVDFPYMRGNTDATAPTWTSATPSNSGGSLTHAHGAYSYQVAAVYADGSLSAPSTAETATIATGSAGSVALIWVAPASVPTGQTIVGYLVVRGTGTGDTPATGQVIIATTTGVTLTDTGALSPTLASTVPYGNLPLVKYVPFLIQWEDQASTWGWQARDFVGRALRGLDNATPNAIEREFWQGIFAQAAYDGPIANANEFLMQSATAADGGTGVEAVDLTPGTVPSITRGIQILEDYLANSGFGGQGMIHAAPETSPNLLGARRVGGLLLTIMDNIVVPGSGYPTSGPQGPGGSTPAAGDAWIYATDLVSVRLDKPTVYPETMAEATDLGRNGEPNTVRIRAQRFGAATFDGARMAACKVVLGT